MKKTFFAAALVVLSVTLLFSSLLIRAVNRAAFQMINVVRRQFRIPGILEGTRTPDYAEGVRAVSGAYEGQG